MDLVSKALVFATTAHASVNQARKYTGEPYIVHPIEVMMLVKQAGTFTHEMLCAALLHDVVEDTPVTSEEIYCTFGEVVGDLVDELTEETHPGNRKERKAAECLRLSKVSDEAQTIKLADLISNSKTIGKYAPDFAPVYFAEKSALLQILTRGDRALLSMAWDCIPPEFDLR